MLLLIQDVVSIIATYMSSTISQKLNLLSEESSSGELCTDNAELALSCVNSDAEIFSL